MKRLLTAFSIIGGLTALSSAASLSLHYTVTPNGGLFDYSCTLSVDQSSSAWAPGMGWGWITFGDVPNNGTSPLADFALTSAPPPPFASLSFSSGGHNGPSWIIDGSNQVTSWVPNAATDTLTWTGTSSNPGLAGTLQFSELITAGGATVDNFKDMILDPVPEPASLLVLGGLVPMIMRRRRKK